MNASPLRHLNPDDYALEKVGRLSSPRLLVYRERVEENVARMRACLEAAAPGSGFRHLCPHVKTCKASWAVDLLRRSGVEWFKCSPNELDLLLAAGASNILVAYPLLAPAAERVARAAAENPASRIAIHVGSVPQAETAAAAARRFGVELDCLIDLDIGMHRTGAPPAAAADLARHLHSSPALAPLRLRGLHAYDGHNNSPDPARRAVESARAMREIAAAAAAVESAGARVERIVAAGTPGFLTDLEVLLSLGLDAEVQVSPGTWIYWDSICEEKLPGLFTFAALLLAKVMDVPGDDLLTLDLGYKRWAFDHGPVSVFSAPGLEFVSASEEHTVLRARDGGRRPGYGEPLLFAPRHVCPTVNLWESFTLVGPHGEVEAESLPVSARNR